ncbi:hypothetical protein GGTG_14298, partial [Gaeumannomyces tritici R3-111a-1]
SAPTSGAEQPAYDWKHVYSCFRKTRGDFTEFCFLCNKWVFDKSEWSDHCRSHFARPDELPVQCDPLLYGGVLATAGYCLFCMADKPLEPELRLRQFLDRGLWKDRVFDHYERYVQAVDDKTLVTCPHPSIRCGGAFDSVKHFEFYLLDAHCRDFVKESTSLELEENNDVKPAPAKRQRKRSAELDREAKVDTYHFVDETVQTACRHRVAAASLPSPFEGHVSPPDSCQIQGWSGDGDARSGDVLLRSPSSLDNDGVEKCFALIDLGILLEQSFPGSILSAHDPASDDHYFPPPADAIASSLAPFPYVNPAEIFVGSGRFTAACSKSAYFFGKWRLRCGRGLLSDARGRAKLRGESSRRAAVGGGAGTEAESGEFSVRGRSCPVWAISGEVVSLSDGFAGSLAGSETRGLLEGVDGPARPSQRLDRLGDGVGIGVDAAAAEGGLGRYVRSRTRQLLRMRRPRPPATGGTAS